MKIKDGWKIKDSVSGLCIKVIKGKKMDRLHIERLPATKDVLFVDNRDFFFNKDGSFDGTGSCVKD